jgi:hypothetical protein
MQLKMDGIEWTVKKDGCRRGKRAQQHSGFYHGFYRTNLPNRAGAPLTLNPFGPEYASDKRHLDRA